MSTQDRQKRLRKRLRDAKNAGANMTELAARAGLSRAGLYKILRGEGEHYDSTLDALEAALDGSAVTPRGYDVEPEALDLFANAVHITKFVEAQGRPGENDLVKLDLLEGYRRMMTAGASLPKWWYELKAKVESGEI